MTEMMPGAIMLQEIREQPEALQRLISAESKKVQAITDQWRVSPPAFISIAARGTSDHAAIYAKYLFETMNGIPVALAAPSVSSVYRAPVLWRGGLVIGISQSGEAADVIAVLEQARATGAYTLAITNVANSPLAAVAHDVVPLHANPEISVAATKTFTSTMAALFMISAALRGEQVLQQEVTRLPEICADVLRQEDAIAERVPRFRFLQECVLLGRGFNMATAYELGLKLRETCYIRTQPFASPDFVHGPIAILDEGFPVFAFANEGPVLDSVVDVLEKTRACGAELVVIGNAAAALRLADVPFAINEKISVPEHLTPFPCIIAGQLIAQRLSVLKGINPDQPRGLNKVTITM